MTVHRVQQTQMVEVAQIFSMNGPWDSETWRDITGANPRCRFRLKEVGTEDDPRPPSRVIVYEDGSIWADRSLVEIDLYDGPKHQAIRNEGRDNVEEDS